MLSGHLAKIAYGCTHAARIGVVSVQDDSVTAGTDQLGTQVGRPVIFDSGLDIQGIDAEMHTYGRSSHSVGKVITSNQVGFDI